MFFARHSRWGPTSTGSSNVVIVRFGSAAVTTTRAAISSPSASATPTARWFRVITRITSAPVRISTPAARAALASASASAPGPPRAITDWPAAPPSLPTESASSTAVEPADHGPIAVYCTARDAIAPRIASVSNVSAT
jgi:hypothetical protein